MRAKKTETKNMRIKLPNDVIVGIDDLIKEGWFPSREFIVEKALRKFLNSNRPELLEKAILEDVQWGLRGGK
jgi:Arc/MetJ-type ribon-helix-helix transcriptional regulator